MCAWVYDDGVVRVCQHEQRLAGLSGRPAQHRARLSPNFVCGQSVQKYANSVILLSIILNVPIADLQAESHIFKGRLILVTTNYDLYV